MVNGFGIICGEVNDAFFIESEKDIVCINCDAYR
jgi:hypothetical protein